MREELIRLTRLIGEENVKSLSKKSVTICGIGAVGGYALEMIARLGVGRIVIADFDTVSPSNINRQILALHSTIGKQKTDVAKERILDINPECTVVALPEPVSKANYEVLFTSDIILDCIDSLSPKVALIENAYKENIPIISSMGAALRRNISMVRIADLFDTYACPLARQVRQMAKKRGVGRGVETVFSTEKVRFEYIDAEEDDQAETVSFTGKKRQVLGSMPTVTAVFGITMAECALRHLLPASALYGEEEGAPIRK